MSTFDAFELKKQLRNAIDEIGFETPTPIQEQAFAPILSGRDVLGIAQTGTGKTLAYMLPILNELSYSSDLNPRVLILVPTRELVIQVVEEIERFSAYMSVRTLGIYGGVNMNTQRLKLAEGTDIVVATPGRIYDLALSQSLSLKGIKKLVIDEVDVMLDLGFRPQLTNILELLSSRRQNIMFSATMTDEVEALIHNYFVSPVKISIAVSGTPLENIHQRAYAVPNFYTKINLLSHLLDDRETFQKVLVFTGSKRIADQVYSLLAESLGNECSVIHSNKSQNNRMQAIQDFDSGVHRILIATDIMARGLDLDKISHVINFDTPDFPENYMHRIGRTGRAEESGSSILFYTEKEKTRKEAIEALMNQSIEDSVIPASVVVSNQLTDDERPRDVFDKNPVRNEKTTERGPGFHEKKEKNKKTNQGGSYKQKIKAKYKKPKTRGDKTYHKRKKRGK